MNNQNEKYPRNVVGFLCFCLDDVHESFLKQLLAIKPTKKREKHKTYLKTVTHMLYNLVNW